MSILKVFLYYDHLYFSIFFFVGNVSATYALYCNDEIECNPENCPLPLTVICTGDNMCMCLEPFQFFEQP
ncbi:transmembrane protein, putative [Medicago truncatula]|uniref:Transmembrane protein, putative n=1 Tax=Medicago truncatula TaxID=3880 RepID=G7INE6_MEDTR|nr:transmembrane protein, putative [Medicago truncatula]